MDHRSEDEVRQLVMDFRVRRQEVLNHRDGLESAAARRRDARVSSAADCRFAGDTTRSARRPGRAVLGPNVSLHVLPFAAGPVFTMTCMYAYFEYVDADLEQDVVHIETHAGFFSIDNPGKVAEYWTWHDDLESLA